MKRLLIVSHVIHYHWQGQIWAFGGYAREVEIWADLFPEVTIACPVRREPPPGDHLPFEHPNIHLWPVVERGGDQLGAKLAQVVSLPKMIFSLVRAMAAADAVHVRCPGNLGLLGVLLAPLFTHYRIAKYAGQWNGYPGEGFPTRLQRWLLRSCWWNAPVTVYGKWPRQPAHVIPFFTSMMTRDQAAHALAFARARQVRQTFNVLFVGRLTQVKRAHVLLQAFASIHPMIPDAKLAIMGDGAEREKLEAQCQSLGISASVEFLGALPYDQALRWYEWADCLALPSIHSEGWPKVVAEAMSYGVHCIAVRHGQIPSMLAGRGTLLEQGTPEELARALVNIANQRDKALAAAKDAAEWASAFSLEGLRDALAELIESGWQVSLELQEPHAV